MLAKQTSQFTGAGFGARNDAEYPHVPAKALCHAPRRARGAPVGFADRALQAMQALDDSRGEEHLPKRHPLGRLVTAAACLSLLSAGCASLRATTMTRLDGGTIAIYRSGIGHPTVVLQSGLGDGKSTWSSIVERLGNWESVFAYDRPGYGESEKSENPRDPCRIAEELHDLLHASAVPPPYLLVGHSLGGLYQYAFAQLYPQEVAGLLLLDPTHPQHWKRMQKDASVQAAAMRIMRAAVFGSAMRREFDGQDKCEDRPESQPPPSCPVRLLTRTRFADTERGGFERMLRSLEVDWQRLLGAQPIERVPNSGRYIHRDKPEVVIAAIRELLAEARARSTPTSRPASR